MKQLKLLLSGIPGLKIIVLATIAAVIFWTAFIAHYYKKSKRIELEQYQDYVRRHSDQPIEEVNVEGAQDSLRFEKETHRKMAGFYMERKQYKSAIPHFERVIDIGNVVFVEENKDFCLSLAEAYIYDRRLTEAIIYLKRLGEIFRSDVQVLRRLGEAYFLAGDRVNGAEALREAIKIAPQDVKSMVLLARLYSVEDRNRKEIPELLQKAISLDPKLTEGYYYYGVFLSDRGEYGLAEETFKAALKLEPFHTPSMARLGMVYFYLGDARKAKEMYELVLSLNKTDYNTLYNLGELYLTLLDDPVTAYSYFSRTQVLKPDHLAAIKKLGILALNNRNYKEACLWFEKSEVLRQSEKKFKEERITTDAELVEIFILHATALESIGRTADAIIVLQKALEEDPLNRIARHKLQLLQLNG